MQTKQRYTLGKSERLKSRKAIEQLFSGGKSFAVFPFKVIYGFENWQITPLCAAFSVSKRHFKKATDRNRVKRLMREAWRLQKNTLQNELSSQQQKLSVFLIYTGNTLPDYTLLFEKTAAILKKLQKLANEKTAAGT
ncbi:MAG TPA: ribonuclease P protein component [Ferruginibacter sp.]|nr:ribonuclease P protein component [Ferruginibacter sp.]HMP19814.1 ribonuclease P protein component [Ferruginibacter sp.]